MNGDRDIVEQPTTPLETVEPTNSKTAPIPIVVPQIFDDRKIAISQHPTQPLQDAKYKVDYPQTPRSPGGQTGHEGEMDTSQTNPAIPTVEPSNRQPATPPIWDQQTGPLDISKLDTIELPAIRPNGQK